jgi:glycerol kinase
MQNDACLALNEMRVDGGAAVNNLLLQFQADVIGVPVVRPSITETTALGAAFLAGLAVGFWSSQEEIGAQWKADRTFEPQMSADHRADLLAGWRKAVSRARL